MKEKRFERVYEQKDKDFGVALSIALMMIGYAVIILGVVQFCASYTIVLLFNVFMGIMIMIAMLQNLKIYYREVKK